MAGMTATDKLQFSEFAIAKLVLPLPEPGSYHPVEVHMPAHRKLEIQGWSMLLTEGVLLSPVEPALSSMVDVWFNHKKVLSVSWYPSKPWLPRHVSIKDRSKAIELLELRF